MEPRQDRKLFLGPRLRRLRRDLGLTQATMAADLGLSASYLNLLERNQRPVTAQVLLRLAEAYELDLRAFAAEAEAGGPASLAEVLADPLFKDLALSKFEVSEFAEASPGVAEAMVRLYRAYADRKRASELGALKGEAVEGVVTTTDWVRDTIGAHRNYFPELDERGEMLSAELGPGSAEEVAAALRSRLLARYGIRVQVLGTEAMGNALRRYDHHRKRLFLSELLGPSGRSFACAYQLALFEGAGPIDDIAARAGPPDAAARSLLRVSLANYLAAAVLMPYGPFLAAVEAAGYDVERVKSRFGVSFEQGCHRLTTLSRPGARGIPFFMLRIDPAGNVSKRFASASFPFARFSGACPRWNIHASFRVPGRIVTQIVETPDGERYFTLARTVRRPGEEAGHEGELAIGLGCELKHAGKLAYARGLDLAAPLVTPIGPACRICERPECPARAAQPVSRTLVVDDFRKTVSPYPFAPG
ncbi:helix-turn-helix domain-containing protein [Lichenibacterium dinghuense]|uniref:helix-turn-helix domain-containing protein n=1 Tax=Lichenibacterium dinghuense TaxID=2895977 RepID=UPI001F2C51E1|nr:helix-turn-helix transcriptional regulator [Lichenibacterium sp. 6Y81]